MAASTVRAPELEPHLGWLNTDRPLRLDGELAGQVVVLDFWTYCCMNCLHILPDLAALEHKYAGQPVTFMGVHSAKFPNEGTRETIRAAILRYEIKHPVIIDDGMKIWRQYAVRSWPTVVVIDSRGRVVNATAGEAMREPTEHAIEQALAEGRSGGTLAEGPVAVRGEAFVPAASGLAFPEKVLADEANGRLFIADSNHNRIVIAELPDESGRAKVIRVVGSGAIGRDDGPGDQATFHHPLGLAAGQGNLYVADFENHLIRRIDLQTYEVSTVVGTGEMTYDHAGGGMGVDQGINSPWDLTIEGSTLYCAMAGEHQIWRIDLPVGFARAFAGNGRENIVDGPAETAALAQPSGICLLDGMIYFADSEVSAVRGIDMAKEQVFTVIGEGLFSYGDVDGAFPQAKLQHPLGVDAWRSSLLVADTYNHKIKQVDPKARSARTLYGSGQSGTSTEEGGPAFFEPSGLSVAGDVLFVADTNNHRIVRIDLTTHAWCEVVLEGLIAPQQRGGLVTGRSEANLVIDAEPIALAAVGTDLVLDVSLPEGFKLNPEAPWSVRAVQGDRVLFQKTTKGDSWPMRLDIPADARESSESEPLRITAAFAVCTTDDAGLCVPIELQWNVPVVGSEGANEPITLSARLASEHVESR